jgi:glycosyltransferase involved in cell wall biosynthesis
MKLVRKPMDKPAPLGGILQKALEASSINVDLELHRLWERWSDLVGPTISQNARPAAIKGKLLLVHVSSARELSENALRFVKSRLSWKKIAEKTVKVYHKIVTTPYGRAKYVEF